MVVFRRSRFVPSARSSAVTGLLPRVTFGAAIGAAALVYPVSPAFAQSTVGNITGRITAPAGGVVADANVSVVE